MKLSQDVLKLRKRFKQFMLENRDKCIPLTENYEKRHFLRMRPIETFANIEKLKIKLKGGPHIAHFDKIYAVEKYCQCRIFECIKNCPDRPQSMENFLEIEFR